MLLAPPNTHESAGVFFHNLWEGWLETMQDFVRNDLPRAIGILLVAWLLFLLVNFFTTRMRRLAERPGRLGVARAGQLRTMASVLRATGIGVITFFTALALLRQIFDFNLGPLIASAGVVGVAIGLAAQTIVKDVINGTLVLVEDQYNVGDVVTIAGLTGTVESLSLRKTTVRGFDGTLYLIPNSQITNVANQSRDFSQTTLNISVDFSADPDKVIALLKQIVMDVRNEPDYKSVFLQDPQVLGIDQIKGSEVIYLIVIKTLARTQYDAIREMQKRIRLALEEQGMLPGSPYRIFGGGGLLNAERPQKEAPAHDPTTNKPPDVNPLTGEGMG